MKLIETFQVGPFHAGHSRSVYAGSGIEVWEEIRAPLNFGAYMLGSFPKDSMYIFLDELPETKPAGCSHCGMTPQLYGDGKTPQVHFEGRNALKKGWAWLKTIGIVQDDEDANLAHKIAA